jgi:hypothetical protein
MFAPLYVWVATLTLAGSFEQAQLDQLIQASTRLKQGDDESRVLSVLGPPLQRRPTHGFIASILSGATPPRWVYGTSIALDEIIIPGSPFPNPFPIKLRLFGPDEDDLIINWDAHGSVDSVVRP